MGRLPERKRAIGTLVAEIRITQEGKVIPMFRITTRRHEIRIPESTASNTALSTAAAIRDHGWSWELVRWGVQQR